MTYTDFMKHHIKPFLIDDDKPANREFFNDTKDALHKGGEITDRQVNIA